MNLPCKYILIGNNILDDGMLCELECLPFTTELTIQLALYKIPNSNLKTISEAIQANSSNKEFYDKINKQLLGKTYFDTGRVQSTILEMYSILNTTNINSQINFNFRYATQPIILNLLYYDLKTIYDYFQDYIMNYNTWKMTYFSQGQNNVNQANIAVNNTVNRPIATIIDKKENDNINENIDINIIKEISFESCLNDLLKFTTDNLLLYFLNKYINIYLNDTRIENEYSIIINDNTLHITIEPLIPNYLILFSNSHYNVLKKIYLNLRDIDVSIRNNILFNIFKQIIFICQFILSDPDKYKYEMHLILKIYLILLFLYALTFSNIYNVNSALTYPLDEKKLTHGLFYNMMQIIQPALDYYIKHINTSSLHFNRIIVNHPLTISYHDENLIKLKEIIRKNEYLKQLQDDEDYINTIKQEYYQIENNNNSKEISLEYTHQKILDINNFINHNSYKSSLLKYEILKTEFQDNIILTPEYHQLLLIMGEYVTISADDILPLIKKYYDIIKNNIISNLILNFKNKSIKSPISTIDLLNNYINKNLPDNTSIETELNILYRIVIPFLYDNYKIHTFIDCFH